MQRTFHDTQLPEEIKRGAVGVIPTDTLYGVVASALNPEAVERVYALKGRDGNKPCIILIDRPEAIATFGVSKEAIAKVAHVWPAPLSIIFNRLDPKFSYLAREGKLPPFRVPADTALREFLARSGPLIAPSANMQGESPATTAQEAKAIFGEHIDFYVDGGHKAGAPSTLVQAGPAGELTVVRQGAFVVPPELLA